MNDIKVSVCIPVYKVEPYIARCVRSLMEQTISGLELIFVNDCTPDNSIQVLEETLKKYDRKDVTVKILHHEKNMGVTAARFTAMNAVTGEYFIHCDPDDWIEPEMYQTMYDEIIRTNADMAYCNFSFIYDDGRKILKEEQYAGSPVDMSRKILDLAAPCWGGLWNKMWKRSVCKDIKCPSSISFCEDVVMSVQMLSNCQYISYIDKGLYNYYQRSTGICRSFTKSYWELRTDILLFLREILPLEKTDILVPAWQQMMLNLLRSKNPYGKVLFKNIPEKMKKMLTQNIYLSSMRFDLLLIKMAFISYDLTIFLYKIYGWIRTEIFRKK